MSIRESYQGIVKHYVVATCRISQLVVMDDINTLFIIRKPALSVPIISYTVNVSIYLPERNQPQIWWVEKHRNIIHSLNFLRLKLSWLETPTSHKILSSKIALSTFVAMHKRYPPLSTKFLGQNNTSGKFSKSQKGYTVVFSIHKDN